MHAKKVFTQKIENYLKPLINTYKSNMSNDNDFFNKASLSIRKLSKPDDIMMYYYFYKYYEYNKEKKPIK